MSTKQNLPPLPAIDIPHAAGPAWTLPSVKKIQLAAYTAGRDAGLEEAAKVCLRAAVDNHAKHIQGRAAHYVVCADHINALKSDAIAANSTLHERENDRLRAPKPRAGIDFVMMPKTGRDLYYRHVGEDRNNMPEWCELQIDEQVAWNDKAKGGI